MHATDTNTHPAASAEPPASVSPVPAPDATSGATPHAGAYEEHPELAGLPDVVTTCGGCDAQCAFVAHVRDDGSVEARMPVPGHPCSAKRLCGRGKRRLSMPFVEAERVECPLRRRPDGTFEPVSWEVAYAEIAGRIRSLIDARGARSLALTTGVSSTERWFAARLMAALGSPNVYGVNGACESSRVTGWQHTLGYSPESDLGRTEYIVYLGRSLVDSGSVSSGEGVARARERGAGVVTVDPRRNSTVDAATEWLKVRPGHDLALLLGIAHVLIEEDLYDHAFVEAHTTGFDEFARAMEPYTAAWAAAECDVDEAAVLRVARGLGEHRPHSVVDCGFHGGIGVAYVNGTQTARMIALVDALLGCYGQPGGNLNPPGRIRLGELDPALFPAPPVPAGTKVGTDRYPLVEPEAGLCTTIGESIELGQIGGLIAYASNPVMGYGNPREWTRMLSELDLLVCVDIRMTETARLADYVLPDVTFLEADRGIGVAGSQLVYRNRVLPPLHPQTRPARRIFRELADVLGVGEYFAFSDDDLLRAQVAPFGADVDELRRTGHFETGVDLGRRTGEPVIATPDGMIAFASDVWEHAGLGRVPFWQPPLVEPGPGEFRLIAGNSPFESHTTTRMLASAKGDPMRASLAAVWLNDARAAEMGVADGDVVEVVSDLGRDRAVAHVTPDIHPSALFTTSSPGGRSGKDAAKQSSEALGVGPLDHTPLRCDRLTGAALTQENVVRVVKA